MELLKNKWAKVAIIIFALLAVFTIAVMAGAFSIFNEATSRTETGNPLLGESYQRDTKAIFKYEGFANSDKNGKLTEISEDDVIVKKVSDLGKEAACAFFSADYRTATGEEGYEYLNEGYASRLRTGGEPLATQRELQNGQMVTSGTNPKIISVVVFPDMSAYTRIEIEYNFLEVGNPEGLSDALKSANVKSETYVPAQVHFVMKPKTDGTYEINEKLYGEQE